MEPALGRAAPVTGLGVLALTPLPARGQAVGSVISGTRLGRCPPVCGRGHLTAIGRVAFALARCLGEIGRCLRIATALVGIALIGIALGVTGCVLRSATDHGMSVRDPLLVGEVAVTALLVVMLSPSLLS